MKKKITAICLCVALVAVAVVGASLAYFTDTKSATNTFTVGNVKIDLIEQEKVEKGLQDFTNDKTLVPGKSNDGNAVSKIVTVKNTGNGDAWVWVDLLIPKYLVSSEYPTNESKNALHWNSYGCFNVEYNSGNYWKLATSDGIVDADHKVTNPNMVAVQDGLWNDYKYVGEETVDGVTYVKIRTTMEKTLPAGKISLPCLAQVYMDWRVTTSADGEQFILPAGDPISTDASWEVIVRAYAIQADGIASVDAAVAAYANNGK
mgnify:CR=1 FL=1